MARRSESAERQQESQPSPQPSPLDEPDNVFSDDHGYADSIAESFADSQYARSVRRAPSVASQSSSQETVVADAARPASPPRRPSVPSPWAVSHDVSRPFRGSLRKSLGAALVGAQQDEAFARNHTEPPGSPTAASMSSDANRSPSFASTSSIFARSQSPFQSASHPYGSYPQEVGMSRTASIATSNSPLQRTSSTRQGPAHPYDLYPQNVQDEPVPASSAIPVGFPGHAEGFHRRVGPDGEPVIIGADGHAEELPPYTRYPEEPATKQVASDATSAIGETQASEDEPLLPPVAEPEAPFFPREPHDFLRQQGPSRRSVPGSTDPAQNPFGDQHAIPKYEESSTEGSEKSWKAMSWKERRKARIFGVVPVWMFVLIMILLLTFATISGGVIGGMLEKHNHPNPNNSNNSTSTSSVPNYSAQAEVTQTVTTTTMIDAIEVTSTPSAFAALPTGSFKIDVSEATSSSQMCLKRNDQRKAWSCSLEPDAFTLKIGWNDSVPFVALAPFDPKAAPQYGAQPPQVYGQTLKLAKDINNPELGTAYQFQTLYNKLVIVESEVLSPPVDTDTDTMHERRSAEDASYWHAFDRPAWSRKSVSQGETPWFCYFNNTLLEGFVYVQNNTIEAAAAAASSSFAVSTSGSVPTTVPQPPPPPASTVPPSAASPSSPWTPPPYQTAPPPSSSFLHSVPTMPLLRRHGHADKHKRDGDSDPLYPKRIKLVERRLYSQQGSNQPYCQQMIISPDGVMKPYRDANGFPISFWLSESDPPDGTLMSTSNDSDSSKKRELQARDFEPRDLPNGGCFCQWQWM